MRDIVAEMIMAGQILLIILLGEHRAAARPAGMTMVMMIGKLIIKKGATKKVILKHLAAQ